MRPLSGAIFDLDGTLADTLPVCYAAFRQVIRDRTGQTYTNDEILARFGPSEEGVLQRLAPVAAAESYCDFLAIYEREHRRCPRPFAGLREILDDLASAGVRLGVVTGKGPKTAQISLRLLGLEAYFDMVEAGSPAGAVKPAAMRRALEAWRLPAEQTISVGDSPSDIRSAREVGVTPLAAAWATGVRVERLEAEQPHALFRRVEEFRRWLQRARESGLD